MTYYFIRVFDDGGAGYREYDIDTADGPDKARLYAFLMDGGAGKDFHDTMIELAKMHTEIVSESKA